MTTRLPSALAGRPKWKRYPIPYTTMMVGDRPDFRVIDETKRAETIHRRLCALCGERLPPNWVAFIGGPKCEEAKLFLDGPMHEACARFAFETCPFLATPSTHYAAVAAVKVPHSEISTVAAERPERMGLFLVRSWRAVRIAEDESRRYFHVPEFARVEWKP